MGWLAHATPFKANLVMVTEKQSQTQEKVPTQYAKHHTQ